MIASAALPISSVVLALRNSASNRAVAFTVTERPLLQANHGHDASCWPHISTNMCSKATMTRRYCQNQSKVILFDVSQSTASQPVCERTGSGGAIMHKDRGQRVQWWHVTRTMCANGALQDPISVYTLGYVAQLSDGEQNFESWCRAIQLMHASLARWYRPDE